MAEYKPIASKRQALRKTVDIDGFYNFAETWYPCRIYDLSVSGAGLRINQVFYPGDTIKLKLGIRENYRIIEATVVNVVGTRIGVRFDVDPVTKDFINDVMNSVSKPKFR